MCVDIKALNVKNNQSYKSRLGTQSPGHPSIYNDTLSLIPIVMPN